MSAGKHSSSLSEQQVSVLTQMLRSQLAAFPACKATLEDLLHPNANTPLGHQVRPLFAIDPDYTSINHGSFGATPLPVIVSRFCDELKMESNLDRFIRIDSYNAVRKTRAALGELLGIANPDDIFLVVNAAEAFNVAAKSMIFSPQFQNHLMAQTHRSSIRVLMVSYAYPMCQEVVDFWMARQHAEGKNTVEMATIEMNHDTVIDEEKLVEAIVDAARSHGTTPPCDMVVLDHTPFAPAFVVPMKEVCLRLRRENPKIVIIVDGAHAVGSMPLAFTAKHDGAKEVPLYDDAGECVADFYFSNCHKWLMAPKSVAFIYARKWVQPFLHPNAVANYYRGDTSAGTPGVNYYGGVRWGKTVGPKPAPLPLEVAVQKEFNWEGTCDPTAYMALYDTIQFRKALGEARIQQYSHDLACRAAVRVAEIWGTNVLFNEKRTGALSCVRMPPPADKNPELTLRVTNRILAESPVFVVWFLFSGVCYTRLSANIYNELSDFEFAATEFLRIMRLEESKQ